jgi:hypothetical protein
MTLKLKTFRLDFDQGISGKTHQGYRSVQPTKENVNFSEKEK